MSEDIEHLDFEPELGFVEFPVDPPVFFKAGECAGVGWGGVVVHLDRFEIVPGSLTLKVEEKVREISAVVQRFRRGAW